MGYFIYILYFEPRFCKWNALLKDKITDNLESDSYLRQHNEQKQHWTGQVYWYYQSQMVLQNISKELKRNFWIQILCNLTLEFF